MWIAMKGLMVSPQPSAPGVWARKGGGFVVRVRQRCGRTGRSIDRCRSLPEATLAQAIAWRETEERRIASGRPGPEQRMHFGDFAISVFERRVSLRLIRSPTSRANWRVALRHLIGGIEGREGREAPGFGELFADSITIADVEAWQAAVYRMIEAGDYSPNSANTWLAKLRTILREARSRWHIDHDASAVRNFDASEHETYSAARPNALDPGDVGAFLAAMRELYPQHFAMAYLGFATGLRPSSLRPLRRKGEHCDVIWARGLLEVRQSQTIGTEVLQRTKQRTRYSIALPPEAIEVLRWHVATQLTTPEQLASDLLFPSESGGFRARSVLSKPFAAVLRHLGWPSGLTARGMRRTFQDLARSSSVADVVARSISGHLTEAMQRHYSTVRAGEQREALGNVVALFGPVVGEGSGEGSSSGGEGGRRAAR